VKSVQVIVSGAHDGEQVSVTLRVERQEGTKWLQVKEMNYTSGHGGAERKLLLEDNERLVVEGVADTETYFDKNQNAYLQRPKARVEEAIREDPEKEDFL